MANAVGIPEGVTQIGEGKKKLITNLFNGLKLLVTVKQNLINLVLLFLAIMASFDNFRWIYAFMLLDIDIL